MIPSNKKEVYSTEEVRVGTWIDGKPLYRCVLDISLSSPTTNTWYYVNNIPANIEKITKVDGNVTTEKGDIYPFYYGLSVYVFPFVDGTISNLQYKVNEGKLRKILMIIEYTKTTD